MEGHFVWMTTWQIQPGALAGFERAWRPGTHAEGMLRAYGYWSEDEREIVGISFWVSRVSCEAGRVFEAEARRREAMAAYVVGEQEAFYRGRELVVPARWRPQAAGRGGFAGDQVLAGLPAGIHAW